MGSPKMSDEIGEVETNKPENNSSSGLPPMENANIVEDNLNILEDLKIIEACVTSNSEKSRKNTADDTINETTSKVLEKSDECGSVCEETTYSDKSLQPTVSGVTSSSIVVNFKDGMDIDPEPLVNSLKRHAQLMHQSGSSQFLQDKDNMNESQNTDVFSIKRPRVDLYAPDTGPQMYHIKGPLVTKPIITKNLPKIFDCLPVHGKPTSGSNIEDFFRKKIQEFVGFDLNDEEFSELEKDCSPELLKTGKELVMTSKVPVLGLLKTNIESATSNDEETLDLCIVRKHKAREALEKTTRQNRKLKYRGLRLMPNVHEENSDTLDTDVELVPGKTVIYRVRMYRPYLSSFVKDRFSRGRNSVFTCDVLLHGQQPLTALRDRFVCHNDFDMRVDVSNNPDLLPDTNAKEVFPSGFLFINNTFYVDTRAGCRDTCAAVRHWARRRHLGTFPRRDMAATLDQLVLKLGYPEVYVHQGDCEHVFVFSEVRLLSPREPRLYPQTRAVAPHQTVYCTTCAEFCTRWVVVACRRVPFDPAFFCDTCFRQYLYKDGKKIGDFKAYSYRGVALNILKPLK